MSGVYENILKRMRQKVRASDYLTSEHADEKMDDEELALYDVESAILSGGIQERQRDRDTGEWKYRIRGETVDGEAVEVIAKISPTGKLFIVTVYRL